MHVDSFSTLEIAVQVKGDEEKPDRALSPMEMKE
jgi:hypothetical protein